MTKIDPRYPQEQEPTEKPGAMAHVDGKESKTFSHPAFGQISASRVSWGPSGTTLYGSDFKHHNTVTVRISGSELNRDLSSDRHFEREQLIEVNLSEAQWAHFVSSLNAGAGTPCTIYHLGGEYTPTIPLRNVVDVTKQELDYRLAEIEKRVSKAISEMEGEIGQSLSKVKREKLLEYLTELRRDVNDRLPFMAKSLAENMETVVEKAKIEVNAYAMNAINRAGAQALNERQTPVIALGSGESQTGESGT